MLQGDKHKRCPRQLKQREVRCNSDTSEQAHEYYSPYIQHVHEGMECGEIGWCAVDNGAWKRFRVGLDVTVEKSSVDPMSQYRKLVHMIKLG